MTPTPAPHQASPSPLREWLRLTRLPGVCTVFGNAMAALSLALYVRDLDPRILGEQLASSGRRLALVAATSALIYAAGMAWNDVSDVDRDRVLHPQRPLPSGRLALRQAWIGTCLLSVAALVTGALLGWRAFFAAGTVLSLALLYDLEAKRVPWLGSLAMAAVRMGHAVFALLAIDPEYFDRCLIGLLGLLGLCRSTFAPDGLRYPLLLGLYVLGLTAVSELESRPARRLELLAGGGLVAAAIGWAAWRLVDAHWMHGAYLPGTRFVLRLALVGFLGLAGILVWRIGTAWLRALRSGMRTEVGPVVGACLSGMLLFDALVAAAGHPLLGVAVLLLYIPYGLFAPLARMT